MRLQSSRITEEVIKEISASCGEMTGDSLMDTESRERLKE